MSLKLTKVLNDKSNTSGSASTIGEYEDRFKSVERDGLTPETIDHEAFNNVYYDLVTDFYEFGWGSSFHFAPRVPGETLLASLARHERYIAHVLELGPGMRVADIGCGVGGPLMEISRFTGAKIVGINSNAYQIERARKLTQQAGLTHLAEFLNCDFLNVDAPDESFDSAYSIEGTCCAPDKVSVYGEVFRLLKPGARFAAYEYCVTDRFDPQDPKHLELKADIQLGGGLLIIDTLQTVSDALSAVGFEVLETRDLAEQTGPSIPWYQPFVGSGLSLAAFRSTKFGRSITTGSLKVLETLRIAPRGSARVAETLNLCAAAMTEAGRLGIFTPMFFVHARKPE